MARREGDNMTERKVRNSNFELLRIISILAIIGYHFYLQTAVHGAAAAAPVSYAAAMFLGSFGRGAVNVFVMIGAWFLIDMRFSAMRMLRLYLACWFYAVLITLGVVLLKLPPAPPAGEAAFKALLRALTPFSSSPLWFVTDYLFLLLLSPFLNRLIRELPQRSFRLFYRVLLVIFVAIPTLESALPGFGVYRYYVVKSDMTWMIVLYLLVGFWKRFGEPGFVAGCRAWRFLAAVIGVSAAFCVLDRLLPSAGAPAFAVKKFHAFCEFLFLDLSSVYCFALAVSAFFGFRRLSFTSPLVNRIARHTLGVYIIHQVPVFIPVMWGVFRVGKWVGAPWFVLGELGVVLAVFVGCWTADCLGSAFLDRLLRMAWPMRLSQRIDRWMNEDDGEA